MLNLFKYNINKNISQQKNVNLYFKKEQDFAKNKRVYKDFPPSIREWNNSIYVFNKNALDFIPQTTLLTNKLIKSYFNLYNYKIERKLRKSRLVHRLRRLSSNKIYLNNGEFKHTNNKVIVTLYVYNKQVDNYIKKMRNKYINLFRLNITSFNKLFNLIKLKGIQSLEKATNIKYLFANDLNIKSNLLNMNVLYYYTTNFYKILMKRSLAKVKLYLYYKQLLYVNESKFNFVYLQHLKKYLEKVYNKNIEFNFINLRHFYLNSDILIDAISLKIRKDRRKLLKNLRIVKKKVNIYRRISIFRKFNIIKDRYISKIFINKFIFNNISHKYITGFRLRISGRLTKRYTASRSISRLSHKGNLLNIDSSYKGLSSVILKGNIKSNLQYTKLNSKTRVGSFGVKG